VRRILPVAREYEEGIASAARKSKIVRAFGREGLARSEVEKHLRALLECEAQSSYGLYFKAKALRRMEAANFYDHFYLKTLGVKELTASTMRLFEQTYEPRSA
jgi:hypothetical protein